MKIAILICGIAAIILTLLTAWYTYQNIQRGIYICAILSAGFSVVSLGFSQLQQNEDDKEIKRVNALLMQKTDEAAGYATGGLNNKPFMQILFNRENDGSLTSIFSLTNYGNYPLSNIHYEIKDGESVSFNSIRDLNLEGTHSYTFEQIMSINRYMEQHPEMKNIQGDLPNLPKNVARVIHTGKVKRNSPLVMYLVRMTWNNQIYTITYSFERKSETEDFKLYRLEITGADGGRVTDLKKFFPLIPSEFWNGFNTKLDTLPYIKRAEAFK